MQAGEYLAEVQYASIAHIVPRAAASDGRVKMMGFVFIPGIGIVIVGIWYAVTGSVPVGITVAAIGMLVIAVGISVEYAVYELAKSVSRSLSDNVRISNLREIEDLLGRISSRVDRETRYIVAAIVAAVAWHRDSGTGVPPPYVTAARASIATEILRQRLAGKTHEQALLFTAEKFGRPESLISEAWYTDRRAARNSVIKELNIQSWELTEEAQAILREIFPPDKKFGRLGEVITAIREDFILERFQRRVERGVVLEDREEEVKELLDELRDEMAEGRMAEEDDEVNAEVGSEEEDPSSKVAQSRAEYAYLPTVENIKSVILMPHLYYIWGEDDTNKIVTHNFRHTLKLYRNITRHLELANLFEDHPRR
jgi:hypothetical protein